MRLAAWTAGRTDTWIERFYRRIKARHGAPKAVTATARKLACVIYHLLKPQEEFVLLSPEADEAKAQMHCLSRPQKEAKAIGYDLIEVQQLT